MPKKGQISASTFDIRSGDNMNMMAKTLKMTMDQILELRNSFALFDKDRDGRITKTELMNMLQASGQKVTEEDVEGIIKELDTNGDGKIEFDEFLRSYADDRITKAKEHEEIRQAFSAFDLDGDGRITKKELRDVMASLGEKMSDQQAKRMLKDADEDGNGSIDFEEFTKAVLKHKPSTDSD